MTFTKYHTVIGFCTQYRTVYHYSTLSDTLRDQCKLLFWRYHFDRHSVIWLGLLTYDVHLNYNGLLVLNVIHLNIILYVRSVQVTFLATYIALTSLGQVYSITHKHTSTITHTWNECKETKLVCTINVGNYDVQLSLIYTTILSDQNCLHTLATILDVHVLWMAYYWNR